MNIKNLSLKDILNNDWTYNSDFQYAGFAGTAELHKGDRIILFRKGEGQDTSVVSLQAIGLGDKKLIHTANELLAAIGINLRMGDNQNQIIKKYGTPDFIDYIEEGYYRYYNHAYSFRFDRFLIARYHYLPAPDLLICLGTPKKHYQKLTEVEIVNDLQMVTAIMENRTACKKLGNKICPSKDRLSLVHQTIENRGIEGIQSEIVNISESDIENCHIEAIKAKKVIFFNSNIKNCSIEGIQSKQIQYEDCVFEQVVFHNYYKTGCVIVTGCTFKNCTFHDTFGAVFSNMLDNKFHDCLFEGISSETKNEGAYLIFNDFLNCIFKDVHWIGNEMDSNLIRGGKMEHILYHELRKIHNNQFINVQMEDIKIELEAIEDCSFSDNALDSVNFRNVTLKGQMGKNNEFINCDTRGLMVYP